MRRFLPASLVFLLVWTACEDEPVGPERNPAVGAAAATITAADVAAQVGAIAHDSMGGRDTPSPGLEASAAYIASRFQAMGLDAAGTDGYLQRFPFTYPVRVDGSLVLRLEDVAGPTLEHGRDYVVMGSEPERGDTVGPIVWAGSAEAASAGGLPMAGRVLLYDLPVSRLDLPALIASSDALSAAMRGGSAAVGFVTGPDFSEAEMARAAARTGRASRWIPQFWIRAPAAEALLRAAGADLATLRAEGPQELSGAARVRALLTEVDASPPNVVGMLRGSDPSRRDEYVVVTAHYDHIGTRLPDADGDSIYNGADDNASGTVAVLELAEALASLETAPARSVLFLLVSGEEYGLLGSAHFARNPTVPMAGIVANLNLDMVGRNSPGHVIGVGREYTSLGAVADSLADGIDELQLAVVPDPAPGEDLFFRSDQLVFACRGVPALFLTTGLHPDYHGAGDEVAALDTDKVARVSRLGFYLVHHLASARGAPTWTDAGRAALNRNDWCP